MVYGSDRRITVAIDRTASVSLGLTGLDWTWTWKVEVCWLSPSTPTPYLGISRLFSGRHDAGYDVVPDWWRAEDGMQGVGLGPTIFTG